MENNSIESYHQAQKATLFTNDRHPGSAIQLGLTPAQLGPAGDTTLIRYPTAKTTFTGLNYYTVPESEKLTKMRQRKSNKNKRQEKKNVANAFSTGKKEDAEEYNIDNVLQKLGEVITTTTVYTHYATAKNSR